MAVYNKKRDLIFHQAFNISILAKGLDGILEIIGGVLLYLASQPRIEKITVFLTRPELSEDPRDFIANYLVKLSHSLSISAQYFGAFYLFSHGAIKVILIYFLFKRRLWSYPVMIVFLFLFIVYQLYRYNYSQEFYLILLSIFDALLIMLTVWEFRRVKKEI